MKRYQIVFDKLFSGFFDSEKVAGLLLVCCTVVSLIIANSAFGRDYIDLIHEPVHLFGVAISIEVVVNDGLMAIFFLLVGLEVERELYVGELNDFKKAILPVAAAVGGVCFPAAIHFLLNHDEVTRVGFAIPMATDIAFALGILALAGNRVPLSVKIFLTALAIIDDIAAIIVIAVFYTQTVYLYYLLGALGVFTLLITLNRLKVERLIVYLILGILMWYLFLKSGVHPTIAGVLLAFAIPFNKHKKESVSYVVQHHLHKPVAFFIVPLFALVNTAIPVSASLIEGFTSPNSLGIIIGLVFGKLLGIFFVPFLLIRLGFAKAQEGITWKNLAGIGLLGGIGFTMSMFISNLAFDDQATVDGSKLSILFASTVSAVVGLALFLSNSNKRQAV